MSSDVSPRPTKSQLLDELRRQAAYAYETSEFYREGFDKVGLDPARIDSLERFRRSGFRMGKEDERASEEASEVKAGHPFGLHLCADPLNVVGISASSGTTGLPTFTYLFTEQDLRMNDESFRRVLAFCGVKPGAVVLHMFGMSMWVLGAIAVRSLTNNGMRTLPVGAEGGPERALQIASRARPEVLLATPSMVERLLKVAHAQGLDPAAIGIRKIICIGEPGAGLPQVRKHFQTSFEAEVFDVMLGSWGMGQASCLGADTEYRGMHLLTEDQFMWELVDPETFEPMPFTDGAQGRGVVTSLKQQARPVIRFDMGDLVSVRTGRCECGSDTPRVELLGRADDMLIVGGVNVYPAAIKNAIAQFIPDVTGEFQIRLREAPPRVNSPLDIWIERSATGDPSVVERIRYELRSRLRFSARVTLLEPGDHQRIVGSTGKTKYTFYEPNHAEKG